MTLALLPRRDHVDLDDAEEFLEQFHAETSPGYPLRRRLRRVRAEIERTGTYVHTEAEVTFGARVAWRNAARCIGRLYWRGLHVRDRRAVHTPSDVAAECVAHLRESTRGGRIRSTITVFAPDRPDARARASTTTSWSATPGTARRAAGSAATGRRWRSPTTRSSSAGARPTRPAASTSCRC